MLHSCCTFFERGKATLYVAPNNFCQNLIYLSKQMETSSYDFQFIYIYLMFLSMNSFKFSSSEDMINLNVTPLSRTTSLYLNKDQEEKMCTTYSFHFLVMLRQTTSADLFMSILLSYIRGIVMLFIASNLDNKFLKEMKEGV